MRLADERRRARSLSRLPPGRMRVGALTLGMVVFGGAVRQGLGRLRCRVLMVRRVNVCERRRSPGRDQHRDEQHMRDALEHHFYRDDGPRRCQPVAPQPGPQRPAAIACRRSVGSR